MRRITIIGMGLIGTSLGMALRSADERESPLGQIHVTGYDKDRRAVSDARGRLAIDRESHNLGEALRDAQLVIVAVPVQAVRAVFSSMAPQLAAGTVVTDVSSTKAQVMQWANELLPSGVDFIGGHPMAGKEQAGAGAASQSLFQEAIYCLTPSSRVRPEAIDLVEGMVQQIGGKIYYIDPAEHDAYVAGISHLPFLLSAALVEVTSRSAGWKEMAPLAASGFRDISRLASGDPEMHRDICLTNRAALTRWINDTVRFLLEVRDQLEGGNDEQVLAMFQHARELREEWLQIRPNMRPGEDSFEDMSGGTIQRPSLFGRFGRPRDQRK
jgi:prephenate dehydrogenase